MDNLVSPKISLKNRDIFDDFRTCIGATDKYSISLDASICLVFKYMRRLFVVPENWIDISVLVELRSVRIMTQGDSNLRPLWRDQQP